MDVKASANSVSSKRVFAQHQALLTLLKDKCSGPSVREYSWLDLCCGKGQAINAIAENLPQDLRQKIHYIGFDASITALQDTKRIANSAGFKSCEESVGELQNFSRVITGREKFDLICLINAVHEISAVRFSGIIFDSLLRLTEKGILYMFDMEEIMPFELGAVPWLKFEIEEIFHEILKFFNVQNYTIPASRWQYSSTAAWDIILHREHFPSDEEITGKRDDFIQTMGVFLRQKLEKKREIANTSLSSSLDSDASILTTSNETSHIYTKLNEFWSYERAIKEFSK